MRVLWRHRIVMWLVIAGLPFGGVHVHAQNPNLPPVTVTTSAEAICTNNPYFGLVASYTDDGTFGSPLRWRFQYSADGTTWTTIATEGFFVQYTNNLNAGYYRALVANAALINDVSQCAASEPLYIEKWENCSPNLIPYEQEYIDGVCTQGTLLFREDFGGNDPAAPRYSTTPVPSMAASGYTFYTRDQSYGSGSYRVVKWGWQNKTSTSITEDLASQWHIQDDHTYFNDYTRGYFLEVDGKGGHTPFYSTEINVCAETELSFSAYVANVMADHQYGTYRKPRNPKVLFQIEDADMDTVIKAVSSGEIPHETRFPRWHQEMLTSAA